MREFLVTAMLGNLRCFIGWLLGFVPLSVVTSIICCHVMIRTSRLYMRWYI